MIGWWGPKQFLPSSAWPAEMFGAYAKIMGEQHHEASPVTNSNWHIGELRMADYSLNRRTLMSLLPVSVFGLASCASGQSSYDPRLETDAQFQAMVLRRMPDYRLTSSITGRAVVRSPGFTINAFGRTTPREVVLSRFISQFEEIGLNEVTFYGGGRVGTAPWRVRFPGCDVGRCAENVTGLMFDSVSEEERSRYDLGFVDIPFSRHTILQSSLDGIGYEAKAIVGYDYRRRVISYSVNINRTAVTDLERDWAISNARSGSTHPIDVYRYENNLAIGVSEFFVNDSENRSGRIARSSYVGI